LPLADVPVLAATFFTLASPVAQEATAGALSVLALLSQLSADAEPAYSRAGTSLPRPLRPGTLIPVPHD